MSRMEPLNSSTFWCWPCVLEKPLGPWEYAIANQTGRETLSLVNVHLKHLLPLSVLQVKLTPNSLRSWRIHVVDGTSEREASFHVSKFRLPLCARKEQPTRAFTSCNRWGASTNIFLRRSSSSCAIVDHPSSTSCTIDDRCSGQLKRLCATALAASNALHWASIMWIKIWVAQASLAASTTPGTTLLDKLKRLLLPKRACTISSWLSMKRVMGQHPFCWLEFHGRI